MMETEISHLLNFAAFTADDIIYMKDSLSAGTGGNHAVVDTVSRNAERAGPKVRLRRMASKSDKDVRTASSKLKSS